MLAESRLQELTAAQQERVELWFESFMARVSQWFVMNTRWITVGFAVIIAFVMHLDTGRVLQQIQTDSELRARLSAMSASLLDQTPEAIKQVQDEYFAVLKELVAANGTRFAAGATPDAASITTRDQAKDWIVKNAAPPEAAAELTRTLHETTLSDRMSTALNKSIDRALTIRGQLTSAGFSVVPAGHRPTDSLDPTRAEFWGIVASVLFLSLGAPFWFNVLKNMTSLKSIVAQKDASASEAKPPAAQAPARAPAAATRSLERSAGETLPAGQPPPDRLPDLPSARRA